MVSVEYFKRKLSSHGNNGLNSRCGLSELINNIQSGQEMIQCLRSMLGI